MDHCDVPAHLLALIYATATDRSKWPEFCAALNQYSGTQIMMFGHDVEVDKSLGIIGGGIDADDLDRYHAYFADKNSWMHMNVIMPVGFVGISDAALPQRELFKTEFYNDWLRQQDNAIGGAAMICSRSSTRFVVMAASCGARGYDNKLDEMHLLLQNLAPHMMRSIEMSSVLSNGSAADLPYLQSIRHGIMLVHRSGRIGFLNDAAERFLSATSIACISPAQRLVAATERMQTFVCAGIRAMSMADFSSLPSPLTVMTRQLGVVAIHCHIFPDLAELSFPESVWSDPVAGAFVIAGSQGLDPPSSFAEISSGFGATPAECRLAQAIMDGYALSEFADARGLSRHTVRNQMRALLHKTGTRNQSILCATCTDCRRHSNLPKNKAFRATSNDRPVRSAIAS